LKLIEVLFVADCPNLERAVTSARDVLARYSGSDELRLVEICTPDEAQKHRFLGSPTVRVNRLDVERASRARTDFGIQCRVYAVDDRLIGSPPIEWIDAALREGTPGVPR